MNKLKTGWAECSIVPSKKLRLAGQFYERISEGVETPITVTALSIEKNGAHAVFVSCDLTSVGDLLIENVRTLVKAANLQGLDPDNIIINATHTHTSHTHITENNAVSSSLDRYTKTNAEVYADDPAIMNSDETLSFLADRIFCAVRDSWKNKAPSKIANEYGVAVVGYNRRVTYRDGSAKMWGETDDPNFNGLEGSSDQGIELLYVFDEKDSLTGIVANVACPSQVLEHHSFISSDYWGKVKLLLRKKFGEGLFLLAQCSAAGDQCPRDLTRWIMPNNPVKDPNINRTSNKQRKADVSMFDIEGTWEIGRRISDEIIYRYEQAKKDATDNAEFMHERKTLSLPIRKVSDEDYASAVKSVEEYIKAKNGGVFDHRDRNALYLACGTIDRYELQQTQDTIDIEFHAVRLGDIAFATNPFELFLDYGLRIKARSSSRQTFLIQLACGKMGYLPTQRAENGGHYSAYVTSGYAGHEGGDVLVEETLKSIDGLFS